jgi:hypothetical protein
MTKYETATIFRTSPTITDVLKILNTSDVHLTLTIDLFQWAKDLNVLVTSISAIKKVGGETSLSDEDLMKLLERDIRIQGKTKTLEFKYDQRGYRDQLIYKPVKEFRSTSMHYLIVVINLC